MRKLKEKTGVAPLPGTTGKLGDARRDRGVSATHVYLALVASREVEFVPGGNAREASWFEVVDSGVSTRLAFDHKELLAAAIARIRAKVEYTSLPCISSRSPSP